VAETERFFLARVADLHHVADLADQLGLVVFSFFFEKMFEGRRRIEVVFDGIFAFAGDDDDVLDAGGDAFFHDVLNLRLVDNGEHFFRLRFGGREKAGAESGGGEDGLAHLLAAGRGVSACGVGRAGRIVGHRFSFCTLQEDGHHSLMPRHIRQWICVRGVPVALGGSRRISSCREPCMRLC